MGLLLPQNRYEQQQAQERISPSYSYVLGWENSFALCCGSDSTLKDVWLRCNISTRSRVALLLRRPHLAFAKRNPVALGVEMETT